MTNQNNTPVSLNEIQSVAKQVLGLKKWADGKDEKALIWARKKANKVLRGYDVQTVRGHILPMVAEMERDALIQAMVQDKCDNAETADVEKQLKSGDWEFESFQSMFASAEAVANRVADKDTFLEQKQGVNRATIDNRRHYRNVATDLILRMEGMHDQYELGMLSKKLVVDKLEKILKKAKRKLRAVKWIKRADGGVNSYIRGCGLSATSLRAIANTALTLLGEMGYRIPDSWWFTNSKKVVVVHEFTQDNERQEMSQQDWDEHSARMFYQLIG